MEMAVFQYIILMTLSTAMSYADVPSCVLQVWYVPCRGRMLKKAVLSFDSGLCSAGSSARERSQTCSVCASRAGTLPQGSTIPAKPPVPIIPIERWDQTTSARFE